MSQLLVADSVSGVGEGSIPRSRLPSLEFSRNSLSPVTTVSGNFEGSSSSLSPLAHGGDVDSARASTAVGTGSEVEALGERHVNGENVL